MWFRAEYSLQVVLSSEECLCLSLPTLIIEGLQSYMTLLKLLDVLLMMWLLNTGSCDYHPNKAENLAFAIQRM